MGGNTKKQLLSLKQQIWIKSSLLKRIHDKTNPVETHSKSNRSFLISSAKSLASGNSAAMAKGDWGWNLGTVVQEAIGETGAVVLISAGCAWHASKDYAGKKIELIDNLIEANDIVSDNVPQASDFVDGKEPIPPDDLITLTHLHEPALLSCLRKRYDVDRIYTSTGPILLAINPFKRNKTLYSEETMNKYWEFGSAGSMSELPPHVFAIADDSYREMKRSLEERSSLLSSPDQSILVSGESGAGKTVTTKFVMQYLATLSKNLSVEVSSAVGVEQQVLQSNPILESFGNARTLRNDNSSRFGKFIEIQFTTSGNLMGASIEVYLLEKVRLIAQAKGERNYHIFYEILSGASPEEREKFFLEDSGVHDFRMTSLSGTYDRRDGVKDYETYNDLRNAMNDLKFSEDLIHNILATTCGLLHASNVTFLKVSDDKSKLNEGNPSLAPVLKLLGVTQEALENALCTFAIQAGKEKHIRSLPKVKAENSLLGLMKATYGAMFTSIVSNVNVAIKVKEDLESSKLKRRSSLALGKAAIIGVLDIFGFESFKKNSFEQLCINYCNEALQQQFNKYVFKLEQDEYEREGIEWSFIPFPDNQDVLDIIDKKGMGIFPILDDQVKTVGGTDKTFANDLYRKCTSHPRFSASKLQLGSRQFQLEHYAGPVQYDTETFVEKNKDEIPREATDLLLSSTNQYVRLLADLINGAPSDIVGLRGAISGSPSRMKGGMQKKTTVGGQFTKQLRKLRNRIDNTKPHYIRCLKPNSELVPSNYNAIMITEQLRYAGVLEAVRVSRVGYPQRYGHDQFVARYGLLAVNEVNRNRHDPCNALVFAVARTVYENLVDGEELDKHGHLDLHNVGIQVGSTKVFLRSKAFDILERLRVQKLSRAAIIIQTKTRQYLAQAYFWKAILAILAIQCQARRIKAVNIVQRLREKKASTTIQTWWRRIVSNHYYCRVLAAVRLIQRIHRGHAGRKHYATLNRDRKATLIQRHVRMLSCYRTFVKQHNVILLLQRSYRCYLARSELKLLKAQARDLHNVREENNIVRKKNALMNAEIKELKNQIESGKALESSSSIVEELHQNIKDSEEELEQVKKTYVKTVHELETTEALVDELKLEICKANEENHAQKKTIEMSKHTYESELSALKRDLEKLREDKIRSDQANTNLLQENSRYEAEIQILKGELGETRSSLEEMKCSNTSEHVSEGAIFAAATVGQISSAGETDANNSNSRSRKMGRQSSLDIMKEISLQKDLEEARNEVECLHARLRSQGDKEDESKGISDESDVYRLQEELSKVKAELQLAISQKDSAESNASLKAVLEESAASEGMGSSKYRALEKANSELTAELDSCRAELEEKIMKDSTEALGQLKKIYIETICGLEKSEALVDELKLEIRNVTEKNNALQKAIEMSTNAYESKLSSLLQELNNLREDESRSDETSLLQENAKYESEIASLKGELGDAKLALRREKSKKGYSLFCF